MEKKSELTKRRPIPPPIPKRNPNTCLSRTPKLNRPASTGDHDHIPRNLSRKPNYYNYQSATLPNRKSQKLDVCTELLNYISELTQELMAETSFTEVAATASSFDEEGGEHLSTSAHRSHDSRPPLAVKPRWPYTRSQSSVAIQTEKDEENFEVIHVKSHLRRKSEGHSIGIQATKLCEQFSASSNETVVVMSPAESNHRPFREVRKMLKEGSIEGIEDEPPVFKPPPPPVTPPPPVQMVRPSSARPALVSHTSTLGPQVRRCLSTFEPSQNDNMLTTNNRESCGKTVTPRKKKVTLKTANVNQLFVEPMIPGDKDSTLEPPRRHKHAKTSNFASKSATVDRCLTALEKQRHAGIRTPPPPPDCHEPPPKIVVEMPLNDNKHKGNSTCGKACSCLCLKRRSPCGSPVPSMGSSMPSMSPLPSSPVITKTTCRGNDLPIEHKLSPETPVIQQEAYNALIAEIRAAIKQRQIGPKKTEVTYK